MNRGSHYSGARVSPLKPSVEVWTICTFSFCGEPGKKEVQGSAEPEESKPKRPASNLKRPYLLVNKSSPNPKP